MMMLETVYHKFTKITAVLKNMFRFLLFRCYLLFDESWVIWHKFLYIQGKRLERMGGLLMRSRNNLLQLFNQPAKKIVSLLPEIAGINVYTRQTGRIRWRERTTRPE